MTQKLWTNLDQVFLVDRILDQFHDDQNVRCLPSREGPNTVLLTYNDYISHLQGQFSRCQPLHKAKGRIEISGIRSYPNTV